MNRFKRRYPSPSLVVSITALIVALGGASFSATGSNFILGRANTATTQTVLSANVNGRTLWLGNSSTAAGATGLGINVALSKPPMLVNSSVKVVNLNADKLDGLDSTQLTRRMTLPFTIGGGAITNPIAVPLNRLVYLMGASTGAFIGIGQVTLFRLPGSGIMWMGLTEPGQITGSFSGTTGTPIMNIGKDIDEPLIVEVVAPDGIRLHNLSLSERTGVLTFLW